MAGFDGHCPHCDCDIGDDNLYAAWMDHDCMADIVMECPKCPGKIRMTMHSVPEFELEKAETPFEDDA